MRTKTDEVSGLPTPTPDQSSPPLIPDHELLRCIGRGSYGEVWLARSIMGTYRAVKLLYRKMFKEDRPYEREFNGIKAFEPVSRSHDGLVDVLHVGRDDQAGFFYYIMELGDDVGNDQSVNPASFIPRTLAKDMVAAKQLPIDECVKLGLAMTSALGHLHDQGLIHRDIKPSNVIFVRGVPKLADIGLVTEISGAASYVGTEGFIPPEGPTGPMADIFSLGKVLYEISTGMDRLEFPNLPRLAHHPDVDRLLELNEIVIKACRQEPTERYRSAHEMHADLRVLENGKSVRRLRVLERRLALAKRYGIAAAISLALGGLGYLEVARRVRTEISIRQRRAGAEAAYGIVSLEARNYLGALPHFAEALRLAEGDPKVQAIHQLQFEAAFAQCPKLVQMWCLDGRVNDVQFSPDGRRLLVAAQSGGAEIFDLSTGQSLASGFGQRWLLETANWSPDGKAVVTSSQDGTAVVWDIPSGKEGLILRHADRVCSAEFSPDGRTILTACGDGRSRIWDRDTGAMLMEFGRHGGAALTAVFSPGGDHIATAGEDNTVLLRRVADGKQIGPALEHPSWVYGVCFSPDGKRLATACFDRNVRLWEVQSGQEVPSAMAHGDGVRSVTYTADGSYLVTAGWDETVRLWDANRGMPIPINTTLKHSARVMKANTGRDARQIATACVDGTVRVWDLAGGQVLPEQLPGRVNLLGTRLLRQEKFCLQVEELSKARSLVCRIETDDRIEDAVLDENGTSILAVTVSDKVAAERTLQVWNVNNRTNLFQLHAFTNRLTDVALSGTVRLLAIKIGQVVRVVDLASGMERFPALKHDMEVSQVRFSPDSRQLLAVAGLKVRVWATDSGAELIPPLLHPVAVEYAQFSPDGRTIVTCPRDRNLTECAAILWLASTGEKVGRPLTHRDGVLFAAFSPDSRKVITTGEDFVARIWDAATGSPLSPPLRHEDRVVGAWFSLEGNRVATVGRDGAARVWDAETGTPLTPPLVHGGRLASVAFPDQNTIVSSSVDGRVWKWTLPRIESSSAPLPQLVRLYCDVRQTTEGAEDGALSNVWYQLLKSRPEARTVASWQISAWHLQHADRAENAKRWSLAAFHVDRLLGVTPLDPQLSERSNRIARARLPIGGR